MTLANPRASRTGPSARVRRCNGPRGRRTGNPIARDGALIST